ncbi:methionine--tRNA ligase [Devosia sp. ZB163]|uniref:methionine--tRNA ligase n=1 Tax=Devosia sp. ZB163 TaxID=3025938 RepID=UPI002362DA2A|nr:methionine--tRNA ligase [Devosia sp. ZB163]MDC9824700.1 methionine--tRNA ligase [Devosia sp. ZB163]
MTDSFYVTTAIAYPNGEPHIGHAYEMITTDAIARWARLQGKDTFFLTGTDEHGIKMVQTAAAQGITARELADRNAARFRDLAARLDVSNDDFIRTTEPRHYEASQEIWRKMAASNNGDIYQSTYKGWYSVRDEAYFDEDELTDGEGGKKFAPTGAEVKWVEEDSYFFRLSAYQDRLLKLYEDRPDFIAPEERRNEIVSFVKAGLRDISISRTTFDWGIPVPGAPGHVMYVWVDALTNYITGVGYPDASSEQFKKFWPANLHVIGKDIIRFHTVYWPAFLMSAGIDVPHRVFAHGFLTSEGKKMSKSVGNIVDPHEQLDLYGTDPVRWYCVREVSFGQDGDWGREKFINRNNSDLANNFGNLAQRSLSMIQKNFGGALPEAQPTEAERAIVATAMETIGRMDLAMKTQQIHEAAGELTTLLNAANLYFADQAPWGLKADLPRMGTILATTADIVRRAAIAAQAFVPGSAAKFLDALAVPADQRLLSHALGASGVPAGTVLPPPEPVFKKFEHAKTA